MSNQQQLPVFRGFGIEHEVMFFNHALPEFKKNKNGEKALPITSISAFQAAGLIERIKKSEFLSDEDRDLLEGLPALEQSGRKCGGLWVLRKAGKDLLVEFVSRNWFVRYEEGELPNRFIDDFVNDILAKEVSFLRLITENQPSLKNLDKNLVSPVSVGMHPSIAVGSHKPREDYTGSFHITITLPFPYRSSLQYTKEEQKLFVDIHQNFANFIQWIEPLLCATIFTPDLSAAGPQKEDAKPKTRGSFRVFRCGWGNFAGSDLRKLDSGISRYANIQSYWRKDLENLDGADKLHLCDNIPLEPGAISAVGSDFRTFGSRDPLRPWHRESGAPMTIPNGLEIRIFDHFDPVLLYPLVQLICLIAEYSRVHNIGNHWVYQDKDWIEAMDGVMRMGWRTRLPTGYLEKISKFFDMQELGTIKRADNVMNKLQERLWKERDGVWAKLLLSESFRTDKLQWPNVNMHGWNTGFSLKIAQDDKFRKEFQKWAMKLPKEWENWEDWKDYFQKLKYHKLMKNQEADIAYYLQEIGLVEIDEVSGKGFILKEQIPFMESYIQSIDNIWLYIQQLPTLNLLFLQQITDTVYPKPKYIQNVLTWLPKVLTTTSVQIQITKYLQTLSSVHLVTPEIKINKPDPKKKITKENKNKFKSSKLLPVWSK